MPQYYQAPAEDRAGAQWVIPQLGYDMRKFHEIKLLLASRGMPTCPVIGNVYLLTQRRRQAVQQRQAGRLRGQRRAAEQVEKYAAGPDKGQGFFRELAAKQLAVFKRSGVRRRLPGRKRQARDLRPDHRLGGELRGRRLEGVPQGNSILAAGRVLPLRARPADGPERARTASIRGIVASLAHPPKSKEVTLSYRLSRFVHRLAFTRGKGLYGLMQRLFRRWDKKPGI